MSQFTPTELATMSEKRRQALWLGYVNAIPWASGQLNHQEFAAFSRAAFYGIEPQIAFSIVLEKMGGCGARNLRQAKIRHSLESAYACGGQSETNNVAPLKLPPLPAYDEALLVSTVGSLAGQVDNSYFIARSPVTTWNRTSAGFLHRLFEPGENVWVTADDRSPNGCLWTHNGFSGCQARWINVRDYPGEQIPKKLGPNFISLSFFERGRQNVWFLANPVDGQAHKDGRFVAGESYRCIEAVTAWRYLVLESDVAPPLLWLSLLALLPLRIVAIYSSGRRGAHALVKIDAASKLEADDQVEFYRREYVPLGACAGTLSAFRLSRLPNCFRGATGQLQQLLYLNPEPSGQPIKDLAVQRQIASPPHENRPTN